MVNASPGVCVMQKVTHGPGRRRVSAMIGTVPSGGTLVPASALGLSRYHSYDETETVIEALVGDGTAFLATGTIGGLDAMDAFQSNPALVTKEGCQWMLVQHNDPGNGAANHDVFVLVDGWD